MTTPSYPFGWPAMSQVRGEAAAWSSASAWNVNFNNGNVNNNHRNNGGFALAVRRVGQ
jgi:RNA-directed DNA polymerase